MNLALLGQEYPNLDEKHIGEIKAVKYKARDGLSVNAVMTWPVGIEERSSLPLVVLPHGGPEDYDSVRFDWSAQYLSRMGYVVLQPNYRGSDQFGVEFREAGRGQWGQAMQDNLSDGVKAMVERGHVDADRVCIVGASYGEYAALAGAVFTPELYKCAVSIGGVFDVPRMLKDVSSKYGYRHWVVDYWRDVVGDTKKQKQALTEISSVNFADRIQAPVLPLHGLDDTVVPYAQSKAMHRALQKAGKHTELIKLKGGRSLVFKQRYARSDAQRIIEVFTGAQPASSDG